MKAARGIRSKVGNKKRARMALRTMKHGPWGAAMELTGVGLYALPQAARLIGATPREIQRWLFGYKYKRKGSPERFIEPLWTTQLAEFRRHLIGFRDLVELRFVHAFVKHGVDLRVVRRCAANAREIFGSAYPFTMERFKTDGRTIYRDAVSEEGDGTLLDLHRLQLAFDAVIRPSLYRGIEFKEDGSAKRWFPTKTEAIVIDPEMAFGKPVLKDFGVTTATISAHMHAEKSKSRVARILDVPVALVNVALKYEHRLAA